MREKIRLVVQAAHKAFGIYPNYIMNIRGRVFFKIHVPCSRENKERLRKALNLAGISDFTIRTNQYLEGLKRGVSIPPKVKTVPDAPSATAITWEDKVKIADEVLLYYRRSYGLSKSDSMKLWYIRQAVKGFPVCETCLEPMRLVNLVDTEAEEIEIYKCKNDHEHRIANANKAPKCTTCGEFQSVVAAHRGEPVFGMCRNTKCRVT